LKQKFIADTKHWLSKGNFGFNTKFKVEIMMIMKQLANTQENKYAMEQCKKMIAGLDQERQVKVHNFIPEYHNYI